MSLEAASQHGPKSNISFDFMQKITFGRITFKKARPDTDWEV